MASELRLSLTRPQAEFVAAQERYPAIVAGFGSGKTEALVSRLLVRKVTFPAGWVAYYAPTFDLVNLIALPRFEQLLDEHGMSWKLNKQEMILRVRRMGAIVFRTMERPERIVGYETADSGIDELDTLRHEHARQAWTKIIARNRQKKPHGDLNTVAVATTPEGFRFTHEQWVKRKLQGYRLIRASTYSNAHNLPDDYIPALEASYPRQLLAAYLRGEFVNLTAGAVYPEFDRAKNHVDDKIEKHEPLHIGMDFNIYRMAAAVNVIRNGEPRTLEELTGIRDTPSMIEAIKSRYAVAGRSITIYPDSSGKSGDSGNVGVTDMALLQAAGFHLSYPPKNPPVRDRVACLNAMILNGTGVRRWRINTERCPALTEAIEQQAYDKNGDPEKNSTGHDHINDALGYFIHQRFPIPARAAQRVQILGV